ncbi:hypothetical protein PENSPDRAFT_645383 [Peniophora sp. CONT]|nr:hypothetical protein PENSPDRAFT_645383 [Peniophora sp. CONT]
MFRKRRGSEASNNNSDVPGINVTEASPRPDITPRMSSRPAVRVNRLSRPSQSPLIHNHQPGTQFQNRTPQPPPRLPHPARQRSTSDPTGRAPVEISRTPRGAPTLAPAPPGAVHAEPHNTIPIPASVPGEGLRPDTVAATTGLSEPPGSAGSWGRRSWIPFRRRAQDSDDSEAQHLEGEVNGINGHDYATGTSEADRAADQYADDVVDWLDVIDPEVATVSTLSNVQNSLFVPDLGSWVNRMPLINLTGRTPMPPTGNGPHAPGETCAECEARAEAIRKMRLPPEPGQKEKIKDKIRKHRKKHHGETNGEASGFADKQVAGEKQDLREKDPKSGRDGVPDTITESPGAEEAAMALVGEEEKRRKKRSKRRSGLPHPLAHAPHSAHSARSPTSATSSISSIGGSDSEYTSGSEDSGLDSDGEMRRRERLMRSTETVRGEYAVLPAGIAWDDWSEQERAELDDYVRHLMHSRRERFRRRLRGFIQFASRPLGFLITLYAVLITFWGAAWVLFLIGWISVAGRQAYFVEICDQILTALFCVVGIGMSPFRAVDTYHLWFIVKYHKLTLKLRKKHHLPDLPDENDLPVPNRDVLDPDLEAQFKRSEPGAMVLTPDQQEILEHHQLKYHKSHTFYRPHETPTHRAFPLALLITITVLLDCHSMFQMALGGTTWGINYHHRPQGLTAGILCCSLSCNITAGILIGVGGRKTRKKEEVEKRLRQALTEEAMTRLEKRAQREKVPEAERGALELVKSKIGGEPHLERHLSGSGDSDRDPLDDRGARWAARLEAAGHKGSRHGSSSHHGSQHKHKKHHHGHGHTPHSKSMPGSAHGSAHHAQVGGSAPVSANGSLSAVASPERSPVGTPVAEQKEAAVVGGINGL